MYFTCIWRELRRRTRQALVVAIGLAIGIGLVVTVSATTAGVKDAQAQVLHSLYGVGTDMTVTKAPRKSSGGPLRFGGIGLRRRKGRRPAPGTHVSRDVLRPTSSQRVFSEDYVGKIAALKDVAAAAAGLTMTDTAFSGTIPAFGAGQPTGRAAFAVNSFSVDGVQTSPSSVGPLDPAEITKGAYFAASDTGADVAVVSSSYATSKDLKVGSQVTLAGKKLSVVGIADLASGAADVYVPLGTVQALSGEKNKVNIVYVGAKSAAEVAAVAGAAGKVVPGSTVTTSADLAKDVTGSLSSAASLASNLGKWLSLAALAVAFAVAALLMMASVSRRVREFGTLKAIGWRTRRIVGEVTGEGASLGIAGAALGLLLGLAGSEIVSAIAPTLTATPVSPFTANGGQLGAGAFGGAGAGARPFASTAQTVLVHLSAPLQGGTVLLAVGLALAGGLIAGIFGAWRAARLRPATALGRVA